MRTILLQKLCSQWDQIMANITEAPKGDNNSEIKIISIVNEL
jgi:hypothetical protein